MEATSRSARAGDYRCSCHLADPASQSVACKERVHRMRPWPANFREALGMDLVASCPEAPIHPIVQERYHPLRARGPEFLGVPDRYAGEVRVETWCGDVDLRIRAGQSNKAHNAPFSLDESRRGQSDLVDVGAQQREARLRRVRAQVLHPHSNS